MHISAVTELHYSLLPALIELRDALSSKAKEFENIIKIGRTHLQVCLPEIHHRFSDLTGNSGCNSFDPRTGI